MDISSLKHVLSILSLSFSLPLSLSLSSHPLQYLTRVPPVCVAASILHQFLYEMFYFLLRIHLDLMIITMIMAAAHSSSKLCRCWIGRRGTTVTADQSAILLYSRHRRSHTPSTACWWTHPHSCGHEGFSFFNGRAGWKKTLVSPSRVVLLLLLLLWVSP